MSDAPAFQTFADQVRSKLPPRLDEAFTAFLQDYGDETFYAFSIFFDAATPAVVLAANTEESFESTLQRYQEGDAADRYSFEEGVHSIRYSPAEWGHHAFAFLDIFDVDLLGDDDAFLWEGNWEQDALDAMSEVLFHFRESDSFGRMKKTPGFVSFAIGADPDYHGAWQRMHRVAWGIFHERQPDSP